MDFGGIPAGLEVLAPMPETKKVLNQTQAEEFLRNIYVEVLRKEESKIDADKSFLGLGGDSLLAIFVIARLREAGFAIDVADIFHGGSITELSKKLITDDSIASEYTKQTPNAGSSEASTHVNNDLPSSCFAPNCLTDMDSAYLEQLHNISTSPAEDIETISPCSPLQEKILIGQAIDSNSYQCTFTVRIRMPMHVNAQQIRNVWNTVVSQRSILRTLFVNSQQRPGHMDQVVLRKITPEIRFVDATSLPTVPDLATRARFVARPFQAPHRLTITQASSQEFYLKLDISHALIDGHSAEVLLKDTCTALFGQQGQQEVLPYRSYAQFQQEKKDNISSSDYWLKYMANAQETHLPLLKDQESMRGLQTLRFSFKASPELEQFCERHRITIANVCQIAWGVVLRYYTGLENVCFSYITSSREAPLHGIMEAVGPFINTLICKMELPGPTKILDALQQVHKNYFESLEHQDEFSDIVSARQWGNTVMSFRRNLSQDSERRLGLECDIIDAYSPTDYDISLNIQAGQNDIDVSMDFWSSKMDAHYGDAILKTFRQAIDCIVDLPNEPVSNLDLLPVEHRNEIVKVNGQKPERMQNCVHELVRAKVNEQPDAPAAQSWDGFLTYRELYDLSRTLAAYLVNQGVGPEVMVGICMDKSKWALVAMLAILEAGGAVVPLGVQHPLTRIQDILEDSEASFILVDTPQSLRLAELGRPTIVVDEALLSNIMELSIYDPICSTVGPNNAAWVIYTSGSTGKPKGVLLEHAALSSSMMAHGKVFSNGPHARVFQFAAYTFDAAIQENFTTLFYGGCVCIPSETDRMNRLSESIIKLKANYVGLTSSTASLIQPNELPHVEQLILFGEPVKASVVETWLGSATLLNGYGPTECSIFSSVSSPLKDRSEISNIGFVTAGHFWVTDASDFNRLCPIGCPGELLIEGPLLARGYVNDPVKTGNAFVTDPGFIRQMNLGSGRRMYRTGDIVQQNANGSLTYLGRRDTQVKIRGQRLDVGEVEYWISKLLPDISGAVVDVIPQKNELVAAMDFTKNSPFRAGAPEGLALLPPSEKMQSALSNLREQLLKNLPSYMVPNIYLPLADMPLTISSKTDRRTIFQFIATLQSSEMRRYLAGSEAKEMPATETGKRLQIMWAEVLKVDPSEIGVHDHFFQIGGDSILAIHLVAMAGQKFKSRLTVADIFHYPKLQEMAIFLDEDPMDIDHTIDEKDTERFELWHVSRDASVLQLGLHSIAEQCRVHVDQIEDVYPCTALQEGLMAITMHQPTAYVSRRVFALADIIDMDSFKAAWQVMIQIAPVLRTRILLGQEHGSLQVLMHAPSNLEWNYSSNLNDYMSKDQKKGIEYGQPLVRLGLVKETSGQRYFVWTAHHSVYDGWSAQLMYKTVAAIYHGESIPQSIPYTRFIRYLENTDSSLAAEYWRLQLDGEVLGNFPVLPNHQYQPKPTQHLRHQIQQRQIGQIDGGLSNVLRAAWALVTSQYMGSNDVVFAVTVSGRSAPVSGITELVAPTITTVPVRVTINKEQSVRDFLSQVQRQAIEMIPFEHTGLQNIKKMMPEAAEALEINNLFVVQPASERDQSEGFPGMIAKDDDNVLPGAFHSHALVMECTLPATNADSIIVDARFDSEVVPEARVASILHQFDHVATKLSEAFQENCHLSDLDMLSKHDMKQITTWNSQGSPASKDLVHELIVQSITKRSNSIAIDSWDGKLTYNELHSHALKLANHLINIGVVPDMFVGMCMDKSKWASVAVLAILYAGGAVMPLGVQHPISRVETILRDSSATIILCDAHQASRLHGLAPQILPVEETLATLPSTTTDFIHTNVQPHHAGWVIYTSGSTGNPKGVVIQHSALCSGIKGHSARFGFNEKTRQLQFGAHTFDITIQEICTTLIHGGVVCVPSEEQRMNELTSTIAAMRVNFLGLTSTSASLIDPQQVPTVKTLTLFGEAVKASVVEAWLPHADVINVYGPSECTIHSVCSLSIKDPKDSLNIGFALNGLLWVADPNDYNRLCPIGAPGELLIEGPALAREYLNDPVKTEAAFITDPLFVQSMPSGDQPRRMYRTGDIVQQNVDGSLTYLGRRDTQVKIRGQRVDVGEIEYWLAKAMERDILTVMVDLLQGSNSQDPVLLVATMDFVSDSKYSKIHRDTAHPKLLAPSEELIQDYQRVRGFLTTKIPAYMVPSIFVPMVEVPRTVTGKTDRRSALAQLRDIDKAHLKQYSGKIGPKKMPTSEIGIRIQTLWAQVFKLEIQEIGLDDHFFQLGGDSITAIQLVEIARKSNVHIAVAEIFQFPTLNDMISMVRERGTHGTTSLDTTPFQMWQNASDSNKDLVASRCGINSNDIEDIYPCTPLQEGLMAITIRRPTAYVSRRVFELTDSIDIDRFCAAWQTMTDISPILRTRILLGVDSQSLQVVVKGPIQWTRGPNLEDYITQDQTSGISLGNPLVRYGLIDDIFSGKRYFIWTAHHSVYDGWSMQLLYQQVAAIYLRGEIPREVSYSKFIKYINDFNPDKTAQYWRKELTGDEVLSKFPLLPSSNYQPNPCKSFHHQMNAIPLLSPHGVSTSNLLRAAWALVVAQYTGINDVLFAVTLSGRTAPVPEITKIVAPTLTTVPVRIRIEPNKAVHDYLREVQQQAIDMMPYEYTGIQRIRQLVPELSPLLDMNHLFVVQPASESDMTVQFPGLKPKDKEESQAFHSQALIVECTLARESQAGVAIDVKFDDKVITEIEISRLLRQFTHLVAELSKSDERLPMKNLRAVNAYDSTLIKNWNSSLTMVHNECAHELISQVAAMQPDAIAVDAWDGTWTYSELDKKAKLLGQGLLELGVGPDIMVGVCMDKSRWAAVAMLGILHAGGAVLPLGIQHPRGRIQGLLADTAASVILTDSQQGERLIGMCSHILVVDESLFQALPTQHLDRVNPDVQPSHVAWVIYTSGSTGTPKGVLLEHRAICSSIRGHGPAFGLDKATRMFQFAAYTFDVSIQELLSTLIYGGCVCVPSEDQRMNDLAETIRGFKINVLGFTSSTASLLRPSDVPTVQRLVLFGEAVKPSVVEAWKEIEVLSAYGPSECSMHSTCSKPLKSKDDASNIGYPFSGNIWIAHPADYNKLVPVGAPGEILIEGPLVARGYLNDSQKTNMSFITDPLFVHDLGLQTGRRMYRTGDIARQNADGSFTYLGRRDTQIKIRGQRLDVGEVEYWISRLLGGGVTAVVDLLPSSEVRPQPLLVAAVDHLDDGQVNNGYAKQGSTIIPPSDSLKETFANLRDSLMKKLPTYMVPTIFLPLTKIPLNLSGKTDRRAVKEMLQSFSVTDLSSYSSRRASTKEVNTESESILRQLWSEVLQINEQNIGSNDDFFSIGGDSIVAMRLAAVASSRSITLNVKEVFQNSTLAKMAQIARHGQVQMSRQLAKYDRFSLVDIPDALAIFDDQVVPRIKSPRTKVIDFFPSTDSQALSVAGALTGAQVEVHYFKVDGKYPYDIDRLKKACQDLHNNIEAFRTTFAFYKKDLFQVVLDSQETEIPVLEVEDSLDAATNSLIQKHKHELLRLGQRLFQTTILKCKRSHDHRILFRMSHAIYDGSSFPVIWKTLEALHDSQPIPQNTDFSAYLSDRLSQVSEDAYGYWTRLLQGSTMPRLSAVRSAHNQKPAPMRFSAPRTVNLIKAPSDGITTAIIVKAAWALVLGERIGGADVVFGDTISGRSSSHPSLADSTVGCCATHVPLRVKIENKWRALDLLHAVRDQHFDRMPYENLGFRDIIENCTLWPTSTRFTSIVNHRRANPVSILLGGQEYSVGICAPPDDLMMNLYDIAVVSEELHDRVEICLGYADDTLPAGEADSLLTSLTTTVDALLNQPESTISELSSSIQSTATPLRQQTNDSYSTFQKPIDSRVIKIWQSSFGHKRGVEGASPLSSPFFDLGGDILDAARFVTMMQEQNIAISLDDLLNHPSVSDLDRFLKSLEVI
ncbi:Nonribosomal peptide synthetase 8 [Talaromyces islandicus]|uniref:Nonribosomal peptide synthetase 8 n=1 Tax=Talaromyces islandicus TaxID=28573 RepID=A0A0U1M6X0_TALIS|nr:Nonribosomal peptide synthetase 8 [Talaromyces islandicus]